jgi:glycerol-3-phosphate O-acyltransferase
VLSNYVATLVGPRDNTDNKVNPYTTPSDRREVNTALAYQVLHEFLRESVVMSTGIVAGIVLAYRHGIDKDTLTEKYTWLEGEIALRGGRVDPLSRTMNPLSIVNRALGLLGREIVCERRSFVEPVIDGRESHRSFLQLGLYRNQLPHIFFSEAVCLVVLAASNALPQSVLCERAEFIKTVLTVEFHTSPDVRNTHDWPAVVEVLLERGLMVRDGDILRLAADDANKRAYFFCSLLWPFIDSHWVAMLSLFSLLPNRCIGEELLISQMQWFAEKLYFDGVVIHFDACSKVNNNIIAH